MDFRLDHVAVYSSDMKRSLAAYQTLGLEVTLDLYNKDNFHFAFVGNGKGYQLQIEPPQRLYDYEMAWQKVHGSTWNHICLFVDDCAAAEAHFNKVGVETIFPTSTVLFVDSAVGIDDEGVNVELLAYNGDIRFGDMDREKKLAHYETSLQQISLMTDNPTAKAAYYEKCFGFKVLEKRADGSIFITDQHYNTKDNDMILKLSPSNNRHAFMNDYYKAHGPTIDHIVFIAEDPKTAWMRTVAFEKLTPFKAPEYDEREGCIAGWLQDPDGNFIMIREPYVVA